MPRYSSEQDQKSIKPDTGSHCDICVTPNSCKSFGCYALDRRTNLHEHERRSEAEREEEQEFIPCSDCDGHPACEDFGCAIELGLGRLVKPQI